MTSDFDKAVSKAMSGINYTYHLAPSFGQILTNGESLIVCPYGHHVEDADMYYFLPNYAIARLEVTEAYTGVKRMTIELVSRGKVKMIRSYKEVQRLLDPLGNMTLEEILHAAQVRMEQRKS